MTASSAKVRRGRRFATVGALTTAILVSACSQFDVTAVENPNVTSDAFLRTPDAARTWVRGTERAYLQAINAMMENVEISSDNYFNNYTTQSKVFDIPRFDNQDLDVRTMFTALARLRESATYGIDVVIKADTLAQVRNEASLRYYRAIGSILAGEHFTGMPAEALGPFVDWRGHLALAIEDLRRARTLSTDAAFRNACTAALARAHHRLGQRSEAVTEATALLAAAPAFLHNAVFDAINGPSNVFQGLISSATNNYQVLPRMDFLDPKYPVRGAQQTSPLALHKAEEAHLILAEALLAGNDLAGARTQLKSLLTLVQSRATELVDSRTQQRGRAGGAVIYPDSTDYRVAFAADQPLVSGLVLFRRTATVRVPTISGTSVTAARIDAITTLDDAYYVLYLMRQEIFLAEGRRMADLGMRYPVPLAEAQTNRNLDASADYMTAVLPPFLPGDTQMDAFTLNTAARTVTIRHDLNRVLATNRSSVLVVPFAN